MVMMTVVAQEKQIRKKKVLSLLLLQLQPQPLVMVTAGINTSRHITGQ